MFFLEIIWLGVDRKGSKWIINILLVKIRWKEILNPLRPTGMQQNKALRRPQRVNSVNAFSYGPTLLTKLVPTTIQTACDMPKQRTILWTEFITTAICQFNRRCQTPGHQSTSLDWSLIVWGPKIDRRSNNTNPPLCPQERWAKLRRSPFCSDMSP